jgi:uncharacterized damage-inducible protein DinB
MCHAVAMQPELLKDLARHQAWADSEHWKTLHANPALLEDAELKKRLNHILQAGSMLATLAQGGTPDPASMKDRDDPAELEAAMVEVNHAIQAALDSVDPTQSITLPRGPQGPFEAPAGVILVQALTHGQHHRGQNAARMRALGVKPPMTDFIYWYAIGRP